MDKNTLHPKTAPGYARIPQGSHDADDAPLLLDVAGAARLLSCSPWSVRQLVQSGALPVVTLPSPTNNRRAMRRTLIPRSGLERYVSSMTEGGRGLR